MHGLAVSNRRTPADFAARYKGDSLTGGHVIKLGKGNDEAAKQALQAWVGGLQVGGGINDSNAAEWIAAGASHVIVTSWLFEDNLFSESRVKKLAEIVGKDKLVIDLSCRRKKGSQSYDSF